MGPSNVGQRLYFSFMVAWLCFVIPAIYFNARGMMTKSIRNRSIGIAGLIGLQGVFGWYMVASGLKEDILLNLEVPRVNHFWLSLHLGSAFTIYSAMLSTGLEILKQHRILENVRNILILAGTSKIFCIQQAVSKCCFGNWSFNICDCYIWRLGCRIRRRVNLQRISKHGKGPSTVGYVGLLRV